MSEYRMFTESVLTTRVAHHHFIPEKDNEAELKALEELMLAYDKFELDGRNHTRKFVLSKARMSIMNIKMSSPRDGTTWRILSGRLTSIPDASDKETALRCCKRLYDRGIEKFMTENQKEEQDDSRVRVFDMQIKDTDTSVIWREYLQTQ